MGDKREELLHYLTTNPGWHTAKELAVAIDRSPRSVKSYLKDLQDQYPIESGNRGYYLAVGAVSEEEPELDNVNSLVINKLLSTPDGIDLYDLADEFYISESAVLNILRQARTQLAKYNLAAERNGDLLVIKGKESDRRHYISAMIYQEISGSFLNKSIIKDNFVGIDVELLDQILTETAEADSIYLNTFDKNNILLHLAIALEREKEGLVSENSVDTECDSVSFATDVVEKVESETGVKFTQADRQDLVTIINGSISRLPDESTRLDNPETQDMLKVIVEYLRKVYNFDLGTLKFYNQFGIHLDRLVTRLKQGKTIHNPLASSIKKSSPTIYECAVLIGHLISDRYQVEVPDNELSFIAMHIGNALSEQIATENMVKAVVLTPNYQNQATTIVSQLNKHFSDVLLVAGVSSDPEDISQMSADLVICVGETIDWQGEVIEISPFVNFNDINVIQQACVRIRHRKLQDGITSELETFFKPEFFYYGRDLANRDAALEKIASCFTQAGVTDASYLTKLKQREELSSTAFGKVAIPHSFNMVALKSRGYILVNPTGIEWGQNAKVYVVIGLAIDPQNTSLFREVFDKISEVMVDEENISQLIQCTTYDQFIDQLINLL